MEAVNCSGSVVERSSTGPRNGTRGGEAESVMMLIGEDEKVSDLISQSHVKRKHVPFEGLQSV